MTELDAARVRYGKNKVVAALVTFAVVWAYLHWFAPDTTENLRGLFLPSPSEAFRNRADGEWVQARGHVEEILPAREGDLRRCLLRTGNDHPVVVLYPAPEPVVIGREMILRGEYTWDLKGGSVRVHEDGFFRPSD